MTPATESPIHDGGTGPEDLLLVRRALGGDRQSVEGVLSRLSCIARFVYRINEGLGYGLRRDELEDAVQQVYLAVWPRLGEYEGASALESWVFGFCRNCLRAEARRWASRNRVLCVVDDELDRGPSDEPMPPDELARSEGADVVWDELARLSVEEKEVVLLRHLEGWSFERIARWRELPASTIKDRCYRALMKLQARLRRRDVTA